MDTATLPAVIAVAIVIAAVSPVWAASFDCAKASLRAEKAICASPTLGALDEENAKLYGRLISTEPSAAVRESFKREQLQWLREERNYCTDAPSIAISLFLRSGSLRTTLEHSRQNTTNIPEVAATTQNLDRLLADESKTTPQPASEQLAPKTLPAPGAGYSDSQLTADGWRVLMTDPDGAKQWWKRAPQLDRNGWRYVVNRETGPKSSTHEVSMPVRCLSSEIGMLLGDTDASIRWLQPEKGSATERVIVLACARSDAPQADAAAGPAGGRGADVPSDPILDSRTALTLQQIRLGRCAAEFAREKNFERAEKIMSASSNRDLTRGTYVRLLKRFVSDATSASENANDACHALGVDGGGVAAATPFLNRMTAYELAHKDVQPDGASQAAAEVVAQAREHDRQEKQRLAEDDPVEKLRLAYMSTNAARKQAYQSTYVEIMQQIKQLRSNARLVPGYRDNPANQAERDARGLAQTMLNSMRANECAPRV